MLPKYSWIVDDFPHWKVSGFNLKYIMVKSVWLKHMQSRWFQGQIRCQIPTHM